MRPHRLGLASLALLGFATLSCKSNDEAAPAAIGTEAAGGTSQGSGNGSNPPVTATGSGGKESSAPPSGTGGSTTGAGGAVTLGTGGSPTPAGDKDAGATQDSAPARIDAAPRDATPLPPAPNVPAVECKEAKMCDDFETYPAGTVPGGGWKVSSNKGATLLVDEKKAYSGTKSILITTPGMTASAWMTRDKSVFPLPNNMMFGRMMTFLTAAPKGGVHWNSIQSTGTRPDTKVFAAYQWGAMFEKVMANYWPPDCSKSSKTSWPVGKWSCVQWQFDGSPNAAGDGRKNEMRLWVDGTLLNDTTIVRFGTGCVNAVPKENEWVAPTFSSLRIGWENYQPSPIPIEMWIDDVAVDPARPISCPPPK